MYTYIYIYHVYVYLHIRIRVCLCIYIYMIHLHTAVEENLKPQHEKDLKPTTGFKKHPMVMQPESLQDDGPS